MRPPPRSPLFPYPPPSRLGARSRGAPGLNPGLLEPAHLRALPMLPGVFSASEIDLGLRLGARLMKLFPAEPAGPAYLASMLQPFPEARLVPTRGGAGPHAGRPPEARGGPPARGPPPLPAPARAAAGP